MKWLRNQVQNMCSDRSKENYQHGACYVLSFKFSTI